MSSPLLVKISRDGKEIGTYDSAEALRLLGLGTLKPTDHYWHLGMGGWELLSKLDASEGLRLPARPEVKPQSKNDGLGCGGCGLVIFLICGFYSVGFVGNSRDLGLSPSDRAGGEFLATCCGAISLIGLGFFIFRNK